MPTFTVDVVNQLMLTDMTNTFIENMYKRLKSKIPNYSIESLKSLLVDDMLEYNFKYSNKYNNEKILIDKLNMIINSLMFLI